MMAAELWFLDYLLLQDFYDLVGKKKFFKKNGATKKPEAQNLGFEIDVLSK